MAEKTAVYNSSQTVTAGATISSPAAAYIYTSLKIITVAPVTDLNGDVVCGTDFTFPTTKLYDNNGTISTHTATLASSQSRSVATYSNINSNAQAYFGGYDIIGTSASTLAPSTSTLTRTISNNDGIATATTVFTDTYLDVVTFYINSNFESVNVDGPKPTGFDLTFEPFVYQPAAGKLGETGEGSIGCQFGTGSEGYGYPPQTLLNSLIANPTISNQYPGLASCVPAGPSLIYPSVCSAAAPVFQVPGSDLTESTILTITPESPVGTAEPIVETSEKPIPTSQAPTTPPQTAAPAPTPTSTQAAPSNTPAPVDQPSDSTSSPIVPPPHQTSQAGNPQPTQPQSPENSPDTSPEPQLPETTSPLPPPNGPSNPDAVASGIASIIGVSQNPQPIPQPTGTPLDADTQLHNPPSNPTISHPESLDTIVPTQQPNLAPGSTPNIPPSSNLIITTPTTIPLGSLPQNLPLSGATTTFISGTNYIIISRPTTIPIPNQPSLQSSTLTISHPTTIPLASLPPEHSIIGSTTLISGTSYIIISSPTTIPEPLPVPNGNNTSGAGGNGTDTPLQASDGGKSVEWTWGVRVWGMVGCALGFVWL